MRLLRLDLLAFGPFTNVSLPFDEERQGLHIVYGPNEAGKTSSLRALRQWLYGIPHNSRDNFLHSHQNLRIGGVLESADGQRLEFVRRKGRSKTLRAADDAEALDESRLAAMLGGVDEAAFRQRFGIDYDELCRGGQAVVCGGGDLGEILFAAGAGIADLGLILDRLHGDAENLFKPRGSVQQINRAISELDQSRRTIKESQLPTTEWVKHDKALQAAENRRTEIDGQLTKARAEKSRLHRIDQALPQISQRKQLGDQRAKLANAPLLPPDFSDHRSSTVAAHRNQQHMERDAAKAIEKLVEQMAQVEVPTELLAHRTVITQLHATLGSYQKAAKDRPTLAAQLDDAERRVLKILRELGREPQVEQTEHLRLSRVQRQRIQTLAGEWKARYEGQGKAARAVMKAQEAIRQTVTELEAIPAAQDAGELRQAIRRAQKYGDLDGQLTQTRVALRQSEEQAEIDLGKLRSWSGTLEGVERLPVPALDTIERFENELADASAEAKRIEERIEETTRKAAKLDQDLERLRLEHDVPTEDDLQHARRRRDEGWQLVRRVWRAGSPAGDAVAEGQAAGAAMDAFAPGGDLAQAFEACIAEADTIADRLRREADRVADKARLTADRQDVEQKLSEMASAADLAKQAGQRVQSQWRGQWATIGVEPLSPREMRSWLNQQQALAGLAEGIRKQRAAAADLAALVRSLREELYQCLQPLNRQLPNDDATLGRTLEYCETVAEEIESAIQQRGQHEKDLQKLHGDLRDAQSDVDQAGNDLEQWQNDWGEAVAALGLQRDARPLEANAVMDAVDELFALRGKTEELRSRIEGIDRDADEFKQSVQQLTAQIADDLCALPVERAVADLYDRLDAAGKAQTKLDGWREQLEGETSRRDEARSQVEQLEREIESMCREAGCASAEELPVAEQRSSSRRDIERHWDEVARRLAELAAGGPLDDFIAEVEQFDPDRLRADLQRLVGTIEELEGEQKTVAEDVGSHRNELRRMDGSSRAAEAQEQAEHLLASIRADAEQYIRLRMAAAVLRRSIERFRDASQGPVLARASDWFAALTLGSFSGLRADYDDKGSAVLVGIRAGSGQAVGVDGMSGGTCDQLYLALRLTLLETYLHAHEPLPFIVDDVLIMFDDERAVAALNALARLSERTQVIFFTHHEHLLDLARKNIDNGALYVHPLGDRSIALEAGKD